MKKPETDEPNKLSLEELKKILLEMQVENKRLREDNRKIFRLMGRCYIPPPWSDEKADICDWCRYPCGCSVQTLTRHGCKCYGK